MAFTASDICKVCSVSSLTPTSSNSSLFSADHVRCSTQPPRLKPQLTLVFSFAVIFPPVGVFLERGCGADLLINILLTLLGYIPGIIHALYIILKY
ncbi:hypothetical protein C8Q75DRAFT_801613 [Abortiporus biennis]|nr:hypothetical protein C8Q75DRAFT_801613 [Abortiporus biennis]